MRRYVLRRAVAALVTLVLLSMLITALMSLTPSSAGRRIAGPFASQETADAIDRELGTDRPLPVRYVRWAGRAAAGDLGESYSKKRPVLDILRTALFKSGKLATFAFAVVVPLSIAGGVLAGLRRGRFADRFISVAGLSGIAIPEFVSGILLIYVFSIRFKLLPATANPPDGAAVVTQLKHFVLPASTLVIVLFGYIARMARTGTIDASDADFTRTATLKGLPRRLVLRRHVLRNGLLPTISVIATQLGYLLGGLVAVERAFNYPGLGTVILDGVRTKDFPLVQGSVLIVGTLYLVATLAADVLLAALNPRVRLEGA
jgi:peptide/nickel transport system permease protein